MLNYILNYFIQKIVDIVSFLDNVDFFLVDFPVFENSEETFHQDSKFLF